jgi:hypothetical protein
VISTSPWGLLAYHCDPTETHALLVGSPAIDAGDLTGCTNPNGTPLTVNQCGDSHTVGKAYNIGAFEHQQPKGVFLPIVVRVIELERRR